MPDIVTNVLYAEIDQLRVRVKELDEVYDALSVSFDALRKKYHDLAHDFFHKNAALVAANHRVKELKAELAEAREALNTIAHGNDYESSTRAIDALKNENVKLRDALDTIEGMATDTTYDIQGIAKGALKAGEGS